MFQISRRCRAAGWFVAALIALHTMIGVPVAQAGMLATETVVATEPADQRAMVNALMIRDEVRNAIQAQGLDPDEALARVATLSDAEVAMVAASIGEDPAGQGLGVVVVAGLVALIVLLVADATGHTDVF